MLPRIDDELQEIASQKPTVYSSLDLFKGFWAIPLEKNSRKYTHFYSPKSGIPYRYCTLPMGLQSSPAHFQRMAMAIFHNKEYWHFLHLYVDDLLLTSENFEDHLKHLKQTLQTLRINNLMANPSKAYLGQSTITYLGHELTTDGVTISDDNVRAIRNIAIPKNKRSLRRLLGLLNYFRKYVKNYSQRTISMRELLKKEVAFNWTEKCTTELEDLKTALISKPILGTIDENNDIYLTVDGSKLGLGGHIFQKRRNGEICTCAYYSSSTTKSQQNWPSYALEMQALAMTLRHYEYILLHKNINVFSDNAVVVQLAKHRPMNAREARLIAYLSQFKLQIRHVAGVRNYTADFLSRMCEDLDDKQIQEMRPSQNLLKEEFILPLKSYTTLQSHRRTSSKENGQCTMSILDLSNGRR